MSTEYRRRRRSRKTVVHVNTGISLGAIVAVGLSWSLNHSIWWGLFHAMCGWGYVVYYFLFYVLFA